jgi:photosystem II stability/assembly factor-like uncharacterized protein
MKQLLLNFILLSVPVAGTAQWQQIGQEINGVVNGFVEAGGGVILAGGTEGVHRSEDHGDSWTLSNDGINLETPLIHCLEKSGDRIFVGTDSDIRYSDDSGVTWEFSFEVGHSVVGLAAFDDIGIIALTMGTGILMSPDNGLSWSAINDGLPTDSILSIVRSGGILFLGSYGHGVYSSDDNGMSWHEANDDLSESVTILSLETDGDKLFAGTKDNGLLISTNNGGTWARLPVAQSFITSTATVYDVCAIGDGALLSAVGGVRRSLNNGASWSIFNDGINIYGIMMVLYDSGDAIFCGGVQEGIGGVVFRIAKDGVTTSIEPIWHREQISVHPNPTSGLLHFDLEKNSRFTLTDLTGRQVISGRAPSGRNTLDVSPLNDGMYVLTLEGSGSMRVVKMGH